MVVRDHQRAALVLGQELLEPADRQDVEVVGRLVEQQHVGRRRQHLRQQHAQLEAAGERRERLVVAVAGDAQTFEDLAGARLERVAVVGQDDVLELGVALAVELVVLEQLLLLVDRLPQRLVAHHHDVDDGHVLVAEVVLAQDADARLLRDRDLALARDLVAGQDAQEGGLARAVGAHHAVPLAGIELQARRPRTTSVHRRTWPGRRPRSSRARISTASRARQDPSRMGRKREAETTARTGDARWPRRSSRSRRGARRSGRGAVAGCRAGRAGCSTAPASSPWFWPSASPGWCGRRGARRRASPRATGPARRWSTAGPSARARRPPRARRSSSRGCARSATGAARSRRSRPAAIASATIASTSHCVPFPPPRGPPTSGSSGSASPEGASARSASPARTW